MTCQHGRAPRGSHTNSCGHRDRGDLLHWFGAHNWMEIIASTITFAIAAPLLFGYVIQPILKTQRSMVVTSPQPR